MVSYNPMPEVDLAELFKEQIYRRPGLRKYWRSIIGRPTVTITKEPSEPSVAVEINTEFFIIETSDGYEGIEWATQDTLEEQRQAFDDLIDELIRYFNRDYRVELRRRLFGRVSRSLKIDGPDGGLVLRWSKRSYFAPEVFAAVR